ncbi:MAG: hypothetical protein ABIB47_06345 [Candidatus Woesearchaeota archaeon]
MTLPKIIIDGSRGFLAGVEGIASDFLKFNRCFLKAVGDIEIEYLHTGTGFALKQIGEVSIEYDLYRNLKLIEGNDPRFIIMVESKEPVLRKGKDDTYHAVGETAYRHQYEGKVPE